MLLGWFVNGFVVLFHRQRHLPLFRPDDHRLVLHAAHHVQRVQRFPAKRHLLDVLSDSFQKRLLQGIPDLEIPVRGHETFNSLVRPLEIVILHPQADPLTRFLERPEFRARQKLLQNRFPKPFNFSKRLRMVRLRLEVMHLILPHLLLEPRLPTPRRVLPAVVGQHLLRRLVLRRGTAVHLQNVFRRLAPVQFQTRHVA